MAPFKKRKRRLSDTGYVEGTRSKLARLSKSKAKEPELVFVDDDDPSLFEATASLPSSPTQPPVDADDLDIPSHHLQHTPVASSMLFPLPEVSHALPASPFPFQRLHIDSSPLQPLLPSPTTPSTPVASGSQLPTLSPMKLTPIRPRGRGRPPRSPRKSVKTASTWRLQRAQNAAQTMEMSAKKKMDTQEMRKATKEAKRAAETEKKRKEIAQAKKNRAYNYLDKISKPESEGGAGFKSFSDFFSAFLDSDASEGRQQTEARITRFFQADGVALTDEIWKRAPWVKEKVLSHEVKEKLAIEGKAIQDLLSRDGSTGMSALLKQFSITSLVKELKQVAPFLWQSLLDVAENPNRRKEKTVRDKELVSVDSEI